MAFYYDLPVFKDTYAMTLLVFELTQHFSREYKFTLGQDMKRDCLMLVRSIYRANKHKDRQTYLEQFLDDFELLKLEKNNSNSVRVVRVLRTTCRNSRVNQKCYGSPSVTGFYLCKLKEIALAKHEVT